MIKIYVDTGGYMPALKDLSSRGLVQCVGADIDNSAYTPRRGEKIKSTLEPWDKDEQSWEKDDGTWDDEDNASPMFSEIKRLIQQYADARHIDTAYRHDCQVFLTSDKGDIWRHRDQLLALLSLQVIHSATQINDLVHMCETQEVSSQPKP